MLYKTFSVIFKHRVIPPPTIILPTREELGIEMQRNCILKEDRTFFRVASAMKILASKQKKNPHLEYNHIDTISYRILELIFVCASTSLKVT